MLRISVMSIFA